MSETPHETHHWVSELLTDRNDTPPTDLCSRRANEGRLVGLADGRQVAAFGCCALHLLQDLLRLIVCLTVSVEKRNLADGRDHFRILRRRGERIAPA